MTSINQNLSFLVTDVVTIDSNTVKLVVDATKSISGYSGTSGYVAYQSSLGIPFSNEGYVSGISGYSGISGISGQLSGMTLWTNYIDDCSPYYTTTLSTYVALPIQLTVPSTGVQVTIDINMPAGTLVEVWCRMATTTSAVQLADTRWYQLQANSISNTGNSTQFVETTWEGTGFPSFDTLQVKVCLKGTDTSATPKLQNFRVLALA